MANTFYDDTDIPLNAPFVKMIIKRTWTGKDENINRPSLLYDMEELSPFTMLDLSKDEVALLNNEDDLITSASLVHVADLRQQHKLKKFCITAEADEFMLMLKRYANLVYVVFSETCPLFKVLREAILALRDFSHEARKRMTMGTKGSILWIVFRQLRQFALGKVNILCEFTKISATCNQREPPFTKVRCR